MKTSLLLDIKEINAKLIVKSVKDVKFPHITGYFYTTGYALHHEDFGYVGFISDRDKYGNPAPYTPCGGKKCLQQILDAGGFNSFEGMEFIKPYEVQSC
jgi:hypothetical protein